MPLYPFRCEKHGVTADVTLAVDERDNPDKQPRCEVCGERMTRTYTTFGVSGLPTTK